MDNIDTNNLNSYLPELFALSDLLPLDIGDLDAISKRCHKVYDDLDMENWVRNAFLPLILGSPEGESLAPELVQRLIGLTKCRKNNNGVKQVSAKKDKIKLEVIKLHTAELLVGLGYARRSTDSYLEVFSKIQQVHAKVREEIEELNRQSKLSPNQKLFKKELKKYVRNASNCSDRRPVLEYEEEIQQATMSLMYALFGEDYEWRAAEFLNNSQFQVAVQLYPAGLLWPQDWGRDRGLSRQVELHKAQQRMEKAALKATCHLVIAETIMKSLGSSLGRHE